MGQTKSIDLPEPGSRGTAATVPSKSRWWLWVLVLGVIALGGWYYRNSRNASSAVDAGGCGVRHKQPTGNYGLRLDKTVFGGKWLRRAPGSRPWRPGGQTSFATEEILAI